jgi:hemerythrin superfamily protein
MAMVWKVLMDDHLKVMQMFRRYDQGETSLVPNIIEELEVHDKVEADIVYPAVAGMLPDFIEEAEQAHDQMRDLIDQISELEPGDPAEGKLMKRLEKRVTTHASREEKILFPLLKTQLSSESYDMGRQAVTVRQEELNARENRVLYRDKAYIHPDAGWR